MNKYEQFIQDNMPKFDTTIVEKFMEEYSVNEAEARKALAEQLVGWVQF